MVAVVIIVMAIVQLHCLIPVVARAKCSETIIACSLCRKLHIWLVAFGGKVYLRIELLVRDIVIIVVGREIHVDVVVRAEILNAGRSHIRMIHTGCVIRDKVNNHLHAFPVNAFHKVFKFLHPVRH